MVKFVSRGHKSKFKVTAKMFLFSVKSKTETR